MTKTLYKQGYLIRVTSWENDGDNYKTEEVQTSSKDRAKQIIDFCNLFSSKNNTKNRGIGNIHYDYHDDEIAGANEILIDFYNSNPNFLDEESGNPELIIEWMIEFAGDLGLSSGFDWYTRVCQKVEVLYFDKDVTCEVVTAEFNV